MTEARSYPLFYPDSRQRGAFLYDILTTRIIFPPASFEELEALDAGVYRYLYPYEVVQACRS
jgi:hypothetical protein